jgi:hypothetical protein
MNNFEHFCFVTKQPSRHICYVTLSLDQVSSLGCLTTLQQLEIMVGGDENKRYIDLHTEERENNISPKFKGLIAEVCMKKDGKHMTEVQG